VASLLGPIAGALVALLVSAQAAPTVAVDPVVSVWYRGTPAGTPKQEELAVIRALGFGGVTWPASQTANVETLKTMAASAGLQVTVANAPKPVTPVSLLTPSERVDLIVTPQNADALTALAWRAVAHGARALAFDSGSARGAGLENADRSLKPWVRAAIDVARQFAANTRFIEALRPGPGLIITPDSAPALDVVMLDADRSWVVIATNTSGDPVTATVRLPTGAPYAIWLNLLDATMLAMNGEAAGPRWNLKLEPRSARVYLIDKIQK
jgi:hypothetical protein